METTTCIECSGPKRNSLLRRLFFRGFALDQGWVCSVRCLHLAVGKRIRRSVDFPLLELDTQHRVRIGALLVRRGLITGDQLALALDRQQAEGGALGAQVIRLGYCTEEQLTAALSEQQGVPWVGEAGLPVGQPFCSSFPRKLCRDFLVYPFDYDVKTSTIFLAARSPVKIQLAHLVRKMLGLNVRIFLVQDGSFDTTFAQFQEMPREGEELVLSGPNPIAKISQAVAAHAQKKRALALRLSHYDRGFWARLMRRSGWIDCFYEYDLVEDFAGRGGKTLPDEESVPPGDARQQDARPMAREMQ